MSAEAEINSVFKKVDETFKLKITAQIKGSGLEFKRFLEVNDLIVNFRYYVLIINDKNVSFTSLTEFYKELLRIVDEEIKEMKPEIEGLEYQKYHDLNPDESFIDYQLESLSYRTQKLQRLMQRIKVVSS